MSEPFLITAFCAIALVVVVTMRLALHSISKPQPLDRSIPPERRIALAKIHYECAFKALANTGSPSAYVIFSQQMRQACADMNQAKADLQGAAE